MNLTPEQAKQKRCFWDKMPRPINEDNLDQTIYCSADDCALWEWNVYANAMFNKGIKANDTGYCGFKNKK